MVVLQTIEEFQKYRKNIDASIGFVPTMGALHEGHMSLVECSKAQNDVTVVSIYVNPTQFLAGEDLERYPRTIEQDLQKCQEYGVDAVFLPSNLYTSDEVGIKAPNIRGYILEGHFRPGHFDGVLQVVMKLLNITQPTRAYFGKKDAQQYLLICQMVENFFMSVEVIGCPTVRHSDGLAKSSRNIYLDANQRQRALSIYKSLHFIEQNITNMQLQMLITKAKEHLQIDSLQYLQITNYALQPIQKYEKNNTLVTIAGFVGPTRLIDNLWI